MVQDAELDHGLLVEPLLVSDDFDSDGLVELVVVRSDHLAKRPLAQLVQDAKPVRNVIVPYQSQVAGIIVVA